MGLLCLAMTTSAPSNGPATGPAASPDAEPLVGGSLTGGSLTGKVAVVTGSGSGIGRASAMALAAAGAAVMVSDIDDHAGAAAVAAVEAAGGTAAYQPCDVSVAEECGALVAATLERFGRLDVLHANAGVSLPFADGFSPLIDPATWDKVIGINLSGVFYCCHHAIGPMADHGGGAIITTASSMAVLPLGGMDAYAASKAGVAGLTRSLAPMCGPLGIRVNAICPGYVETPLTGVLHENEDLAPAFAAGHAEPGWQTAEEIGDVVAFLASDAARSFTGAVLTCDRGWAQFKQPEALRAFQTQIARSVLGTEA
jgi:NAD(P)-dependent dehydrogenase (short-subunit alcohol dehydrogenase family)